MVLDDDSWREETLKAAYTVCAAIILFSFSHPILLIFVQCSMCRDTFLMPQCDMKSNT